ncbi:MAG: hypothetical protein ACT4ON_04620 [Bacteroidota bacterium]
MKQPIDLFELIKSLNKNEKRFISLFASVQAGEKKYLKLFNAIDKQKEYDEGKIRQQFKGEKFINQLTFTKNYLYNFILKSLNIYHSQASVDAQLKELIRNAEILLEKSLLKQCRDVLQRAKQLASYHDKYPLLLEIIKIEKEVIAKTAVSSTSENDLNSILGEELDSIEKLSNLCNYWNLYSRLLVTGRRNWRLRSDEEMSPFKAIMSHELLSTEKKALSFGAQHLYYHLQGMCHFFKEEMEQAFIYLDKACKMYESRPERISENLPRYISARSNVILALLHLKKFSEASVILDELKNKYFDSGSSDLKKKLFQNYHVYYTYIHLNACDFEKGIALVSAISEGFEKYNVDVESKIVLCFNIANLYFAIADYNSALLWTNKILNDPAIGAELRQDLVSFVKIFNLVIHFELGNQELIDYLVKSTYRFLYKRERLYQFETIVLDFIRKYSKINNRKEAITLFKEVKEKMLPLTLIPYEKKAFDKFDFIPWIESKIEGKSFADVLRSKIGPIKNI